MSTQIIVSVAVILVGVVMLLVSVLPARELVDTGGKTREQNFQALLSWERDGIFPRIGMDTNPPEWYVAEKKRRGITVRPAHLVTPEEFADPAYRRAHDSGLPK